MAIENERKYVLLPKNDLDFYIEISGRPDAVKRNILQAYMPGDQARIRYMGELHGEDVFLFTFKQRTTEGTVEIETNITRRDFELLCPYSHGKIKKERFKIKDGDLTWEIDFFRDINEDPGSKFYLIMAEVEMPEGMEVPPSVPSFVADNLLYLVEPNDRRFDNSNLSDPGAVRANIEHIMKWQDLDVKLVTQEEQNGNQSS